jgi:hypothetical protein
MVCVQKPDLEFLLAKLSAYCFAFEFPQLFDSFGNIAFDDLAIERPSSWHVAPFV